MKNNVIKDKSFNFAVRIVKLYQFLHSEKREFVLSEQILKSGTSIGAMVRKAGQAESRTDFIDKLAMAKKEINETIYWLELLKATKYLSEKEFTNIHRDAVELVKIMTAILSTAKRKINK